MGDCKESLVEKITEIKIEKNFQRFCQKQKNFLARKYFYQNYQLC